MASNLNVSVEPGTINVVAGATATARLNVENRGEFVGQYQVAAAGFDASAITFEPDQLGIFPGSNATSSIRISLPPGFVPATYPVVLRVINQNDPTEEARALLKINVGSDARAT